MAKMRLWVLAIITVLAFAGCGYFWVIGEEAPDLLTYTLTGCLGTWVPSWAPKGETK